MKQVIFKNKFEMVSIENMKNILETFILYLIVSKKLIFIFKFSMEISFLKISEIVLRIIYRNYFLRSILKKHSQNNFLN